MRNNLRQDPGNDESIASFLNRLIVNGIGAFLLFAGLLVGITVLIVIAIFVRGHF